MPKTNQLNIIEGLIYLYPHKKEIFHTHPAMKGTWRCVQKLLKQKKNSILAPLLVDDINRNGFSHIQSVDDILMEGMNRKYSDLPWLGGQIMESKFEKQYGNLGCKAFDSLYHRDVILGLILLDTDWTWTLVNPVNFKAQQAGMIENLWGMVSEYISFNELGSLQRRKGEEVRKDLRSNFLSHFNHYWIDDNGEIESITKPLYTNKKIHHVKK